jgi:hypothetical protein
MLGQLGRQKVAITCQQQHVQLLLQQRQLLGLLCRHFCSLLLHWLLLPLLLRLRLHQPGRKRSPACQQDMPAGLHNHRWLGRRVS